ncbi:MAG: hypothetical protein ACPGSD_07635 [Flavobacteriales bacterium]
MKRKTNRGRVMKIGNKLVEGPSAIFRLSEGDWLEKDLHLTIWDEGFQNISTYSLWTDNSMNKEEDFLPPMIRILHWKKRLDLDELKVDENRKFPKIELDLGTIKNSKIDQLENSFISIQKAVKGSNNYVPYKISKKLDGAELNIDDDTENLFFSIYVGNGSQSLEFSSSGNYSNSLVQQIQKLTHLLRESIDPVNKSEWKERYYELTEEYLEGEIPEWYYEDEMNKKTKS